MFKEPALVHMQHTTQQVEESCCTLHGLMPQYLYYGCTIIQDDIVITVQKVQYPEHRGCIFCEGN